MPDQPTLSEKELKALAYFAVGVSSEGNLAGRDVSSRLSFAGRIDVDGKMHPVEKSGFSIGTLQKDLGQDKGDTATALVVSYQNWAHTNHPEWVLTEEQRAQTISDLARNGDKIRDQHNRPLNAEIKGRLDTFLASDGGKDFVHQRDQNQVEHIYSAALTRLARTAAYQNASIDDQIRLATVVAKAFNQNEGVGRGLLGAMEDKPAKPRSLNSLADVQDYSNKHFGKSMREGRDAALIGAEVYTQLQVSSLEHPLHAAWQEVLKDPLIKPSLIGQDASRPNFAAEYTMVKNVFLEPGRSKEFIYAMGQGNDYSYGRPQAEGKRRATSGFFASGADFVQWNADGKGVAYIGGEWLQIARDDIYRTTKQNHAVDLSIVREGSAETLLYVGPASPVHDHAAGARVLRQGMHGDDVNALQSQLAQLSYTDARGRPLRPDGDFGGGTYAAVQAFQVDHGLGVDGVAGSDTMNAIRQAVQAATLSIAQPEASYLQRHQGSDPMSTYRSFAPEPVPGLAPPPMIPAAGAPPTPAWPATQAPVTPGAPVSHIAPADPSQPGHPDHALNQSIREGVQALYASEGITLPSQQLNNVTAALMADARAYGVDRVHLMEFSHGGRQAQDARIILYSRDPDNVHCNECSVDAQQVLVTPAQQSYQQFDQVKQQQVAQDLAFDQQMTQSQQQAGPMMMRT